MIIKDTGKDLEQLEPGSYPAVCCGIIDIGTQTGEYEGKQKVRKQIRITWELDEKMSDGTHFTISQFYTSSLNEKAKLRQHLEAWRGKAFTQEELEGFDVKSLLGTSCMLSLAQKDNGKIKVASVARIPKGLPVPTQTKPTVYFSLDAFDQGVFDGLSDGIKKMIIQAPEYQALLSGVAATEPAGEKLPF